MYKRAWKIVSGFIKFVWKWSKLRSLWLKNLSTKPDFSCWKGASTANFWTDRDNSSWVTSYKFTGPVLVAMLTLSNSYECSRDNDNNWIQMQPQKLTSSLAMFIQSPTYQSSFFPKSTKYSRKKSKTITKIVKLAFRFRNLAHTLNREVPKQASPLIMKSIQRKMWKRIKNA